MSLPGLRSTHMSIYAKHFNLYFIALLQCELTINIMNVVVFFYRLPGLL